MSEYRENAARKLVEKTSHLKLVEKNTAEAPKVFSHNAAPLQADWKKILPDLSTFGELKFTIINPAVSLSHKSSLNNVIDWNQVYLLAGENMQQGCLTSVWSKAAIVKSCEDSLHDSLRIMSSRGEEILRLDLTEQSNCIGFASPLIKQWSKKGHPQSVPDKWRLYRELHMLDELSRENEQEFSNHWYNMASSSAKGRDVNVSLLIPLFEALVDQYCRFRVFVGNKGILTRYDHAWFDFEHDGDQVKLWSTNASLNINLGKVAIARVGNYIQLYDTSGDCVMSIELVDDATSKEQSVWERLILALIQ